MKTYDHLFHSHLEVFPRAYAISAKQKQAHRQHREDYWAALKEAAQAVWTKWVAPSRCDHSVQDKRQRQCAGLST